MTPPYVPKYVSPKQAAEARARRRAMLFWTAVIVPLVLLLLLFGYSDQAPAFLRDAVAALDGQFGYPLLALLKMIVAR
jgi:hypothetical protein